MSNCMCNTYIYVIYIYVCNVGICIYIYVYINIYVYKYMCEKPIYALDVPCRCTDMETSPFDRANGSSSARCGKQAARTPHKSEKCNVGRSSIGTGCRLSLLGCGYPFCWKPRRIRGSWVPTFVDSSPSYIGSGALGAHGVPCKAC